MASKAFECAAEVALGESIESIRRTPICEQRLAKEKELGRPLRFRSYFPFIGRGNVLRDRAVPHERVEAEFLRAIDGK